MRVKPKAPRHPHANPSKRLQSLVSEKLGFPPRKSRQQIRDEVLGGAAKFKSDRNLAHWFVKLANAKTQSLGGFFNDASYLASTRGASSVKDEMPTIQSSIQGVIAWALDPESETGDAQQSVVNVSHPPLKAKVSVGTRTAIPIISQRVTLRKSRGGVELAYLAPDFEGAILSALFSLLGDQGRGRPQWIGQCQLNECRKVLALFGKGRPRLFCNNQCREKSRKRPEGYFRDYRQKERKARKRFGA